MNSTPSYLLSDSRKALQNHRLLSAIQSLQGMATILKAWNESEELHEISNSYQTLIKYFSLGTNDPKRITLYNQFKCRIYEISDILERLNVLNDNMSFYATSFYTLRKLKDNYTSPTSFLQKDMNYRDLFHAFWLSPTLRTGEEQQIMEYIEDQTVDNNRKALLLSALTLGTLQFFDISKIRILIKYTTSELSTLRSRAITGIIFVIIRYSKRIDLYPNTAAQIRLLLDNPRIVHELELAQTQLFLSLDTKRIERNLQEEIIPRMMKRMKDLKLDRSLGIDELKEKLAEADINPEWDDDGKPSKLNQYMKEFAELQQRGADLYMGTFKMLKQRFPFFREISNWFTPFTMDHPEIPTSSRENKTLKLLLQSNGLCDADKYAFCLIANQLKNNLPEDALKGMIADNKIDSNQNQSISADPEKDFKDNLRSYVQGFYRFYNLYGYCQQFTNVFQEDLLLTQYAPFDQLLNNRTFVIRMADFTFKDKAYQTACELFEKIPVKERSYTMWQKIGFCYEQLNDIKEAANSYNWAYDMKSTDTWTPKRLANCLRQSGQYKEALIHYNTLSQIYPNDANIAFRQGECNLHLHQYDEAFKGLFKADYLEENSALTMRALAWCSLLTHKYEQAERYYQKILSNKPTHTDYLNAGHAAWFMNNLPLAIERYGQSVTENDTESFLNEDLQLLHDNGLTDDEINIMIDTVLNKNELKNGAAPNLF